MSTEHDPDPAPEPDPVGGSNDPLVSPASPAPSSSAPAAVETPAVAEERHSAHEPSRNMLPGRERRRSVVERLVVRLIATCGVVGIGVAIAAIMVSSKAQGWIVGLVVSAVTVILSGLLWSSRNL